MTPHRKTSRIGSFFSTFGSAVAVARAVEGRRRPLDRDLFNLGILPETFNRIILP